MYITPRVTSSVHQEVFWYALEHVFAKNFVIRGYYIIFFCGFGRTMSFPSFQYFEEHARNARLLRGKPSRALAILRNTMHTHLHVCAFFARRVVFTRAFLGISRRLYSCSLMTNNENTRSRERGSTL